MSIKKKITLEIEFDNGFIPPEKFEGMDGNKKCLNCPFYLYEQEECRENCVALDVDVNADWKHDLCPIRKFFN